MTKTRLAKAIAASGYASRRKAERLILDGKVTLNGETVTKPETVTSPQDEVFVEGEKLPEREKKVYFLLNKPAGYVCSHSIRDGKKRVFSLFEDLGIRLFSVGRLDKNTTGLLLLTNDGDFAKKVIHPSSNITKEYLVKTREEMTLKHIQKLSQGITIDGTHVTPYSLKKMRKGTFKIGVKEGKKREVRLLVEKAGLHLLSLQRIRIGGLHLGKLEIGTFRELKEKEREAIFH